MSRTDKTRPFFVRLSDVNDLPAVEHHDHRYGPCDLVPLEHTTDSDYDPNAYRCGWVLESEEGHGVHSSVLCHGEEDTKISGRRRRHGVKRVVRVLAHEYNTVHEVDGSDLILSR